MKRLIPLVTILLLHVTGVGAADWQNQLAALELKAKQGDPKIQTELAVKYENAEGVAKDLDRAATLYCQAAKQGYAEAQFKLGWMYANGRGVPRDDSVAAVLLGMALDQGYEHASKLLPYLSKKPDLKLPSCLLPDPPAAATSDEPDAMVGNDSEIKQLVRKLAPEYAVDFRLALAVISVESAFNPGAVSPKKAQGLMQLIPATADRFGVKRVFNPVENIKGGLAYLRWLLAFFEGDVALVLAAYNAGEGAVEKYRGIPPYAETRDYVKKITQMYKKTSHPYEPGVVNPSPIMAVLKRKEG